MKLAKVIIGSIFIGLYSCFMHGGTVGSNASVGRQGRAFFNASDSNNKMQGFSVFEKGFALENGNTTCSFDSFFPISGDVVLNGGTLQLQSDLVFRSPFKIGAGRIEGNSFSLEFPRNVSYFDFPSLFYTKVLIGVLDQKDVGADVHSVDWSYDDKYVALGIQGTNGVSELQIFSFGDESLTLVTSEDFGTTDLRTVRWHPSSYHIATGASAGTELKTWLFTTTDNALQEIDNADIGGTNAVAWTPDGNYLAVGGQSSDQFRVYPVTNGSLGTVMTETLGASLTVQYNALDWDATGTYIAAGFGNSGSQSELQVFKFDGFSVTVHGTVDIGATVNAVGWIPNTSNLSVGHSSGTERLQLYSYDSDSGTLTEVTTAQVGQGTTVRGLNWNSDATYLAVVKSNAAQGYETEIYYYDANNKILHLASGFNSGAPTRDVRWSHDAVHLATGDENDICYIFNFTSSPFVINSLKLFFGSEVHVNTPIKFEGSCVVNGGGHILDLKESSSLIVTEGATLQLEDMIIKGITGDKIHCLDEQGTIILRDVVWMQDADTTFTIGSMQCINDVKMVGDSIFSYESNQTSTIMSGARLKLDPGLTFKYNPQSGVKNLIEFEDDTSLLTLNGATLCSVASEFELIKGKIIVKRDAYFASEQQGSNEGITIGNGSAADDCACDILSGEVLHVNQGALNYKNVNLDSWKMISERSFLKMMAGTTLRLFENIDLGLGVLVFGNGTTLARASGKKSVGRVSIEGSVTVENM